MPKIVADKKDWIKLGYKLFSESGESGLNVDKMSRMLQCNKSSFYWHFKTKAEFINELVKYWTEIETEQIIEEVEKILNAKERLETFLVIAFKNEPYLEFIFFLKRYAKSNTTIQKTIDKVDKRRLNFTAKLFEAIGYPNQESMIKAEIFYKYLIGHHEMIKNKKQPEYYIEDVKNQLKHFLKI
ncbi:MAG: TetR/AcrR family transcriptional regulator [Bacteroidota bacterium]